MNGNSNDDVNLKFSNNQMLPILNHNIVTTYNTYETSEVYRNDVVLKRTEPLFTKLLILGRFKINSSLTLDR